MKDNILTALKTKYTNLGFSEKAFAGVAEYLATTVTEDAQIETATAGVESLLKAFQGDIDSRVTAAVKKRETELKAAQTPQPQQTQPATAPPTPLQPLTDEPPTWVKKLFDRVDAMERKETQTEMLGKLKAKLSGKVPEAFVKQRQVKIEKEDQIDELATTIEAEYLEFRQEMANQGVMIELPKKPAGVDGNVEVAKRIAERRNNPGVSEGTPGIKL